MKERLTQRQNEAYEFIRWYARENRMPPTLQEIGDALGIASTNGVYKLLQTLESKGYIEREKHAARGITILEDEQDPFAQSGGTPTLPLIVQARSDQPEALRSRPGGYLSVDARMLGTRRPDDCLVLRVGDDGMNGDGIRKGDLLVVAEADWTDVSNGEIVGVLVQDQVLARRFGFANGRIHLRPADRHYTEETFPPDDPACCVIGPVVALLRTFGA